MFENHCSKISGLLKGLMISELIYNLKVLDWDHNFLLFLFKIGTIVSIGDPKKKYTRYEKIGQG